MLCALPQTALTGLSGSPSRALPGDTLNSMMDTSFCEGTPASGAKEAGVSSVRKLTLMEDGLRAKMYTSAYKQIL